jgi:hypothetical protein
MPLDPASGFTIHVLGKRFFLNLLNGLLICAATIRKKTKTSGDPPAFYNVAIKYMRAFLKERLK